jgi:hypothetical protein
MAVCRLMLFDYMKKHGRFGENCPCAGVVNPHSCKKSCDQRYYSNEDIVEGILYCEWLQELGKRVEPFYRFRLDSFIRWAQKQLRCSGVSEYEVR